MDKLELFPPMAFRLHEDDHERYGEGPWTYDELAVVRLPVRELIAIEAAIGMSVTTLLYRFRQDFADAKLAAAWIARRQAGTVDSFDSFDPLVTLMTVERPEADARPPDLGSTSTPSTDPPKTSVKRGSRGSRSTPASRRTASNS